MANLSWQYYKGYYNGFVHWDDPAPSEENKRKEIEQFFKKKNTDFIDFELPKQENESINQIQLFTTYPGLLIGSGYTHQVGAIGEFKIGFQLDYTTGLPIIPGSSVKGMLRSVFPEIEIHWTDKTIVYSYNNEDVDIVKTKWMAALIKNIDDDDFLKTTYQPQEEITEDEKIAIYSLTSQIFDGIKDHTKTKSNEKNCSIYERDIFFDAYPIEGNVNNKILGTDSITPHGNNPLKNPIPLLFLKVLPNVCFRFNFDLKNGILTIEQKLNLFKKILLTIGIGAKTNVGYGQLSEKTLISKTMQPLRSEEEPMRIHDERQQKTNQGRQRENLSELAEENRNRRIQSQDGKKELQVTIPANSPNESAININDIVTAIITEVQEANLVILLMVQEKSRITIPKPDRYADYKINEKLYLIVTAKEGARIKGVKKDKSKK